MKNNRTAKIKQATHEVRDSTQYEKYICMRI